MYYFQAIEFLCSVIALVDRVVLSRSSGVTMKPRSRVLAFENIFWTWAGNCLQSDLFSMLPSLSIVSSESNLAFLTNDGDESNLAICSS